jgi:RNA polymerase sigma factor (sigma-70 family)
MNTAEPQADSLARRAASAFAGYRNGNPSLMSGLVDEATPLLWHVARAQGLDQTSAEDVVQTAWTRLVEHADRIDDGLGVLKWLITTTKREAWRVARVGRREDLVDDVDPTPDSRGKPTDSAPELALLASEEQTLLWQHFTQLPERCRALLRVVAFADRPDYASVAHALGMPIGSIGPTRGRCLAKLRVLLMSDPAWTERT